jgi:hypothetical protein
LYIPLLSIHPPFNCLFFARLTELTADILPVNTMTWWNSGHAQ